MQGPLPRGLLSRGEISVNTAAGPQLEPGDKGEEKVQGAVTSMAGMEGVALPVVCVWDMCVWRAHALRCER